MKITKEARRAASLSQLQYRLPAVDALIVALELKSNLDRPKALEIFLDGKLTICGNSNAFINPVIEAGVIHCRVLLEFLGLCQKKDGRLGSIESRRDDDCRIEDFDLPRVSPQLIAANHLGQAVLEIFRTTNKGLAHATASLAPGEMSLVVDASKGIRDLFHSYFYKKLNRIPPKPGVTLIAWSTAK
jgi:hypothetical protein